MSFASPVTSHLRRVPDAQESIPGHGRHTIVGHVDRWFLAHATAGSARTALLVLDVDIDDALPDAPVLSLVTADPTGTPGTVADADAVATAGPVAIADRAAPVAAADRAVDVGTGLDARRARLGRSVARAIGAHVRPGDAVARIDTGRFAVLRGATVDGTGARDEASALARGVEDALVGRPEGFGVRVTAGALALAADAPRAGASALGAVTAAMLEGKLLTDDRVVVSVARPD